MSALSLIWQWETLKGKTTEHFGVANVRLAKYHQRKHHVTWDGVGAAGLFDVVLLATGFGHERSLPGVAPTSYWDDDALTAPDRTGAQRHVLIVGAGDGGLIDLFRTRVRHFDHATLAEISFFSDEGLAKQILDLERDSQRILGQSDVATTP